MPLTALQNIFQDLSTARQIHEAMLGTDLFFAGLARATAVSGTPPKW